MSVPSVLMSCHPIVDGLQRVLGLSIDTFALALNVDRRTVERWRADQSVPQGETWERHSDLVALRVLLVRMFGMPEAAQE